MPASRTCFCLRFGSISAGTSIAHGSPVCSPHSEWEDGMGVSDPEIRNRISEDRWLQYQHLCEKQQWPWWKRLMHRLKRCPLCRPERLVSQGS